MGSVSKTNRKQVPAQDRRPQNGAPGTEQPATQATGDQFAGPRGPNVGKKEERSAEKAAAFKALLSGASLDKSGARLAFQRRGLSRAQLEAAVAAIFGPQARLTGHGVLQLARGASPSAELTAAFKAAFAALEIDAQGDLSLKAGKVDGSLSAKLKRAIGPHTLSSTGKLTFAGGRIDAGLEASLVARFGQGASLTPRAGLDRDSDGRVRATVGLAAFKRLKALGKSGAVEVKGDGKIVVRDGRLDRAEVSALLTAVFGKQTNLDAEGKVAFADGAIDATLSLHLANAWDGAEASADGSLKIAKGRPEVTAALHRLFPGAAVEADGTLSIKGADSAQLGLALSRLLPGGAKIDAQGSLKIEKDALTASLTTSLVSAGDPAGPSLEGLVSVDDASRAAELTARYDAGLLAGAMGLSAGSSIERYRPTAKDAHRLEVEAAGGFWSRRTARYRVGADASLGATVLVGTIPVKLGVGASASAEREVRTLTLHPSEEDATRRSGVTVTRWPRTLDAILAMRPYEMASDTGAQAIGFTGEVAVGLAAAGAQASVGGKVYWRVEGELSRDFERLDGDRVRVRIRRGDGKLSVAAVSAAIDLGGAGAARGAVASKLAAPLEKAAALGLSASWERLEKGVSCFDLTLDLARPHARLALAHLLRNDLSEAQHWAGFSESGVSLNESARTRVVAETRQVGLDLGPLSAATVDRWADKASEALAPGRLVFAEAAQRDERVKPLWPWAPTRRTTVKFVRQTDVSVGGELPEVGLLAATGTLRVRIPPLEAAGGARLARTRTLLGVRVTLDDSMTSLDDMRKGLLGPALRTMRAVGFSEAESRPFAELDRALTAGAAPPEKPIVPVLGVGDRRFGATRLDLEGFVAPRGFFKILHRPVEGPDGERSMRLRSERDFVLAYLDTEGEMTPRAPLVSRRGVVAAVESTLGACLVPGDGGFDVEKDGRRVGRLSDGDLSRVQERLLDRLPPEGLGVDLAGDLGEWEKGARPRVLLKAGLVACVRGASHLVRARRFAQTISCAVEAFRRNRVHLTGEGPGAAPGAQALFADPERYFDEIEAIFRRLIADDAGRAIAPMALLSLASPDGVFARAELTLPPEAVKGCIEAGRRAAQRFGAVSILAHLGARVSEDGALVVRAPRRAHPLAVAAARVLFGDGVESSRGPDGRLVVRGLGPPGAPDSDGLVELLAEASQDDGAIRLPAEWTAARRRELLARVFGGGVAVETEGRVALDNTSLAFVHLGDALSSAFGPGAFALTGASGGLSFPTAAPVADRGETQSWDRLGSELLVRHKGSEAGWHFATLANLRGKADDFEKPAGQDAALDWLLKD